MVVRNQGSPWRGRRGDAWLSTPNSRRAAQPRPPRNTRPRSIEVQLPERLTLQPSHPFLTHGSCVTRGDGRTGPPQCPPPSSLTTRFVIPTCTRFACLSRRYRSSQALPVLLCIASEGVRPLPLPAACVMCSIKRWKDIASTDGQVIVCSLRIGWEFGLDCVLNRLGKIQFKFPAV